MKKSLDNLIKSKKRMTFTFNQYQEAERLFIESTLEQYLTSIGLGDLNNRLCYCLHELASNACKANSKRVYFAEKQLDINNPEDYKTGIRGFKNSISVQLKHFFRLREKEELYIKFQIKRDHEYLYISIINNVPLTDEEHERIQDKLRLTEQYDNIIDAINELEDSIEGAGLGIFTMMMMFKEMGMSKDDLNIFRNNNETHAAARISFVNYT